MRAEFVQTIPQMKAQSEFIHLLAFNCEDGLFSCRGVCSFVVGSKRLLTPFPSWNIAVPQQD